MMKALEVLYSGGQVKIPWPHPDIQEEYKENFYQHRRELNKFNMKQQEIFDKESVYSEEQEEESEEEEEVVEVHQQSQTAQSQRDAWGHCAACGQITNHCHYGTGSWKAKW